MPLLSETLGQSVKLKFSKPPPTYCPHQYRSTAEMTSTFETRTQRYGLRSRNICIKEQTPITSPETLSRAHETQDESINTMQETSNRQFRLFLSVSPCMPHIDSEKSANCTPSPPPQYLAPLPVTPPRTSHLPLHLAPPRA